MIDIITRLRLNMLSWLLVPVILTVLLSSQILKTANFFGEVANTGTVSAKEQAATSVAEIPNYDWKGEGLVTLWFDDGWKSQYEIGYTVLEANGFKGTLAVPTRAIDSYGYMSWLQVMKLQHKGWEINAHSRTHNCDMLNAQKTQVDFEVLGSMEDLKNKGLQRNIYVTPCGVENTLLEQTVKNNYGALRTSNPGFNSLPIEDKYDLKVMAIRNTTTAKDVQNWLKQAKLEKQWLILMFHRLDDSVQEYDIEQRRFEEIIEVLKNSDMPVVLPSQVLRIPSGGKRINPSPSQSPVVDSSNQGNNNSDGNTDNNSDNNDSNIDEVQKEPAILPKEEESSKSGEVVEELP